MDTKGRPCSIFFLAFEKLYAWRTGTDTHTTTTTRLSLAFNDIGSTFLTL